MSNTETTSISVREAARARAHRERAAHKFRPDKIDTLLVAEAPPAALDRYFYFPEVREQDSLFRHVCRVMLDREPTRENKPERLAQLRDKGVYLIDLSSDPLSDQPLSAFVPDLVRRCKRLDPSRIILIKTTVYDTAYTALIEAGLPVTNERIPFPGSGQQRRFLDAFARALSPSQTHRAAAPAASLPSEFALNAPAPGTRSRPHTRTHGHRSRFTFDEIELIRTLLTELRRAERSRQKEIRARLRTLGFYITDYETDQQGFTASDLDDLLSRGAITVKNGE